MRATVAYVSALMAASGLGCNNATSLPSCASSSPTFSNTVPNFVATVSQVTRETGLSPEGPMDQYVLWLAVAPDTVPTAGLLVLPSTPVFGRAADGRLIASAACAIKVGDHLDVWRDSRWAFGAAEAPPGDTLYFGTQLVVH